MNYLKAWSAGLLLALTTPATLHAEVARDRLTIGGFGTFGLTHSNSDDSEFIRDIGQPEGVSDGWSADIDSRLGLQLGYRLSDELDAVVQAVSRYHYTGNYEPQLTWAFLRYAPTPDVQIRAGRVGLDSYMLADSRDVGYAYLWVRPPVDYYGHRHLAFIDGGDIKLTRPVGAALVWAKLFAGRADDKFRMDSDGFVLDTDDSGVIGGHVNYESGPWHLQLSYNRLRYDLDAPPQYMQYVQWLAFQNPRLAAAFAALLEPVPISLYSAGAVYNRGPLRVQAMYSHLDRPQDVVDVDSGFVTIAYRVGPVTPYLTLAGAYTKGVPHSDVGLPYEGRYGIRQHTASIGARYDVTTNVALKTQLDYIDVDQSGVIWRDHEPGWRGNVTIFSLALDFIF